MADNTELIAPPPKAPQYPIIVGIGIGVVFVVILVYVASRFDPTRGPLTISLIIIIGFISGVSFSFFYTIPQDPSTSALVGALVSSVGAIIAYWLGKKDDHTGNH